MIDFTSLGGQAGFDNKIEQRFKESDLDKSVFRLKVPFHI